MNGTRVRALAVRIARGFRRDPRSLALLVVVPLTVMILIGYLISDSREPLRVGLVAAATDPTGRVFATALAGQPGIEVEPIGSASSGETRVRDGSLDGAIVLDPNGVRVIVAGEDVRVEEPIVQAAAIATAEAHGQHVATGGFPGVTVDRVELPTNVRPSTISYSAPALVTVFAFLFTFMLTSVAFLRERSSGTLERLLASPIRRSEILSGYLLGFIGFALFQTLLVLGYAILVLHAQVAGQLWLVLVVLAVMVVGVVNLGITLSFFARNELQVIQFIPLMLLPQVFLGGLFWPVQTLWPPLRWLSALFPMTHAVAALRAVMIAGADLADIAGQLVALAAFAAAMVALGVLVLRRQRA